MTLQGLNLDSSVFRGMAMTRFANRTEEPTHPCSVGGQVQVFDHVRQEQANDVDNYQVGTGECGYRGYYDPSVGAYVFGLRGH